MISTRSTKGGTHNLKALSMNAAHLNFANNSFDLVTALEVLEHIPDLEKAIAQIYRVSKSYIIISISSRTDSNPEYIHFIDKNSMLAIFRKYNVNKIDISYVHNHMLAVVKK